MPFETSRETAPLRDATSQMGDKLGDAASTARNTVSNLGRSAVEAADNNREAAARGLQTAAATIRERADSLPGGQKVADFANGAADRLSSTADYVRHHDVRGMVDDLERLVKNNPAPCLVAAAAIGFVIGRAVARD
jgi:ElaB/YqjD/DUF883 family membrane-anchored ribosome-binding protein